MKGKRPTGRAIRPPRVTGKRRIWDVANSAAHKPTSSPTFRVASIRLQRSIKRQWAQCAQCNHSARHSEKGKAVLLIRHDCMAWRVCHRGRANYFASVAVPFQLCSICLCHLPVLVRDANRGKVESFQTIRLIMTKFETVKSCACIAPFSDCLPRRWLRMRSKWMRLICR